MVMGGCSQVLTGRCWKRIGRESGCCWKRIGGFYISGTWMIRNEEIEAARKQRPMSLVSIEPLGGFRVSCGWSK